MDVEDETPRLLRALALSQRFHLYLAQCPSPRAADRLIDAIEAELPKLRGAPVRVVRLEPYAGRTTDAPLTTELNDRVLIPLLAAPEELRAHGTIHVVDASRATSSDDDAWARLFASWNEKRNVLQQLQGEVVVLLPRALWLVFATAAPDVWSIRSGEYQIGERGGASPSPASSPVIGPAERGEIAEPPTWRLIPPLSLFGGDVVIAAWLPEVLRFHEVRAIHASPVLAVDADVSVSTSHRLRAAAVALGDRQFARAEGLLAGLADGTAVSAAGEAWIQCRIHDVLAVAVAAQDRSAEASRHAERAQAATESLASDSSIGQFARASVLGSAAYVAWCSGHLEHAVVPDSELALYGVGSSAEAGLLLAMERGRMVEAGTLAEQLVRPLPVRKVAARPRDSDLRALSRGMVAADFAFLGEDIANARRNVEDAAARSDDSTGMESGSILALARPFAALLAAAQGDLDGAERVLRGGAPSPAVGDATPEAVPRQAAFEAYAAGVVATERGDRSAALARFEDARRAIARWAQVGFDRRSLWRAHVATLLSACAVDDDPARSAASALEAEQRAEALLGDTGEDHIARVLAVLARRARMRNTTDLPAARALAHEAAQLAAPLRADGVACWSVLADACMRDAEREAR